MAKTNLSRTVKLTPGFLATAASWDMAPEELARRVCEDFERENPPSSAVLFILDGGIAVHAGADNSDLAR